MKGYLALMNSGYGEIITHYCDCSIGTQFYTRGEYLSLRVSLPIFWADMAAFAVEKHTEREEAG